MFRLSFVNGIDVSSAEALYERSHFQRALTRLHMNALWMRTICVVVFNSMLIVFWLLWHLFILRWDYCMNFQETYQKTESSSKQVFNLMVFSEEKDEKKKMKEKCCTAFDWIVITEHQLKIVRIRSVQYIFISSAIHFQTISFSIFCFSFISTSRWQNGICFGRWCVPWGYEDKSYLMEMDTFHRRLFSFFVSLSLSRKESTNARAS